MITCLHSHPVRMLNDRQFVRHQYSFLVSVIFVDMRLKTTRCPDLLVLFYGHLLLAAFLTPWVSVKHGKTRENVELQDAETPSVIQP